MRETCVQIPRIECADIAVAPGVALENCKSELKKVCREFEILELDTVPVKQCSKQTAIRCFEDGK